MPTVARTLLGGYAFLLLLLPVLWTMFGENYWPLILLRYAPGVIFLVPLLPLMAMARDRIAWGFAAVSVFLVVSNLMGLQARIGPTTPGEFSAMTFNIRAGLGGPKEIGEFLKRQSVDVIALQEARAPMSDLKADPMTAIQDSLEGYSMARGGLRSELVLLSRHPIVSFSEFSLGGLSKALDARVTIEGRTVRFLTVHFMTGDPLKTLSTGGHGRFEWLNLTARSRRTQFLALSDLLREEVPTVLLGDFNTPPNSEGHARLSINMVDSFGAVGKGFGYTYRSDWPVWRIDNIWLSGDLIAKRSEVVASELSDHRPVTTFWDFGQSPPVGRLKKEHPTTTSNRP